MADIIQFPPRADADLRRYIEEIRDRALFGDLEARRTLAALVLLIMIQKG